MIGVSLDRITALFKHLYNKYTISLLRPLFPFIPKIMPSSASIPATIKVHVFSDPIFSLTKTNAASMPTTNCKILSKKQLERFIHLSSVSIGQNSLFGIHPMLTYKQSVFFPNSIQ